VGNPDGGSQVYQDPEDPKKYIKKLIY